MLLDWELFKDEIPSDKRLVQPSIEHMELTIGLPKK